MTGSRTAGFQPEPGLGPRRERTDRETQREELAFARDLMAREPSNIVPHLIFARSVQQPQVRLALLERGLEIGLARWMPAISGSGPTPDWVADQQPRALMACLLSYQDTLLILGCVDEATTVLRVLLKLDPTDDIGPARNARDRGIAVLPDGPRMPAP